MDCSCNCKRFILSVLAVAIFIFFYEFVVHGILLEKLYAETPQLWRTETEMQEYFLWAVGITLLLAMVITFIFTRNYEGKGVQEGLRFGVYVGLFMGIMQVGIYPYMPISLTLAGLWFVSAFIEGVGVGVLLSLVYRR